MTRPILLLGALVVTVFILQGCTHLGEGVEEVRMIGLAFEPREHSVPVGTTVVWINDSGFEHTTTSTHGLWESPLLGEGDSYSYTFDEPGEYPYVCLIHEAETMTGTIVVEDGGG